MMADYSQYYAVVSPRFDQLRLDTKEEVERHCAWFMGSSNWDGGRLLDVGCGTGRYAFVFALRGMLVTGLDISQSQIAIAKCRIQTVIGSAPDLPFTGQAFEVVSFIMMLHQLSAAGTKKAIEQAHVVLVPRGRIWIKTCSHDDMRKRPFNDVFPSALKVNQNRYPPISDLRRLFFHHGFKPIRRITARDGYELTGAELLARFSLKHNSTLHLIPADEFTEGLRVLSSKFAANILYRFEHSHTLLEFMKI